jgi:hypothetical protein
MTRPLRAHFTLEGGDGRIDAATIDLRADLSSAAGRNALTNELKDILGGITDESR